MKNESTRLEPEVESAAASRRFVGDVLRRWGAADLIDVAEVLTSELVSNVVRHAVSTLELDMEWEEPMLRVSVRDGSSVLPAVSDIRGAHGGYGLLLVSKLSSHWGVSEFVDGKAVWFELARSTDHEHSVR